MKVFFLLIKGAEESLSDYLNADSWSRWLATKTKGLTPKGLEMLNESIHVYIYCLLTAQISTRASIIGEKASNFQAQTQFFREVELSIKRSINLQSDIKRYQDILSNTRKKLDFNLGLNLDKLPSNLILNLDGNISTF